MSYEPPIHDPRHDEDFYREHAEGDCSAANCSHCGSMEDPWFSRSEPIGYFCSDCGKDVDNADKEEEAEPLFTIAEIADYVAGWHLATESGALANALNQLHDDQDGILAVRERKQSLENAIGEARADSATPPKPPTQ